MENITLNTTDIINSQVDYKGAVKIFYVDKNSGKSKIIYKHNEGSIGLFTAICRMLVGLNVSDFIPSTIMAYNDEEMQDEVLSRPISYASAPVMYNDSDISSGNTANIVQYTFLIPASNIIGIESIKVIELQNNMKQQCAVLKLKNAIDVDKGSNIVIYWKLKFSNFK